MTELFLVPAQALVHQVAQAMGWAAKWLLAKEFASDILGVDSLSILFSHRSFQNPPGILMVA